MNPRPAVCRPASRLRSPTRPHSDDGSARASAVIAGASLLLPLLFAIALFGTDDFPQSLCGRPAIAQPSAAGKAETTIPARYLRLYQQTGRRYGLPWNLLAAIGQVESDHGRDPGPGVRSGANWAGAAGPMQIGVGGEAGDTWGGAPRHPAGQRTGGVGVDGDGDGWADVHDPADAIPAAARFLLAHGAPGDIPRAVFAYNHDAGYVRRVLTQAARYAATRTEKSIKTATGTATCAEDARPLAGTDKEVAARVLAYARAQLGKPYVYGGTGPDAFDCSGLTMMAYRAAGITIPRLSDAQYWFGKHIPAGTEQPGDLVFFHYLPGHSGPSHVGIVYDVPDGLMIVAPHTGADVRIQSYRDYPGGPAGFTRPSTRT